MRKLFILITLLSLLSIGLASCNQQESGSAEQPVQSSESPSSNQ
jgi:hypothetical protein